MSTGPPGLVPPGDAHCLRIYKPYDLLLGLFWVASDHGILHIAERLACEGSTEQAHQGGLIGAHPIKENCLVSETRIGHGQIELGIDPMATDL